MVHVAVAAAAALLVGRAAHEASLQRLPLRPPPPLLPAPQLRQPAHRARASARPSLGAYAIAYNVILVPFSRIAAPIQDVFFPAFSRIQDDHERIADGWIRVTRAVAAVTVPVLVGLAIVADDFVDLVLGPEVARRGAGHPDPRLGRHPAVAAEPQHRDPRGARPRPRDLPLDGRASSSPTSIAFVVGLHWGIIGVAVGYAISTTIIEPSYLLLTSRAVGISPWRSSSARRRVLGRRSDGGSSCRRRATGSSRPGSPTALRLVLCTAAGVAVYVPLSPGAPPRSWRRGRAARARRRGRAAPPGTAAEAAALDGWPGTAPRGAGRWQSQAPATAPPRAAAAGVLLRRAPAAARRAAGRVRRLRPRLWVTFDKPDARALLAGERVVHAYGPTNRNVPNLLRNLRLARAPAGLRAPLRDRLDRRRRRGPVRLAGPDDRHPGRLRRERHPDRRALAVGPMIKPVASEIFVQWPELAASVPRRALRGQQPRRGGMIFVTTGTNEQGFDRLMRAARELGGDEELVVQYGSSSSQDGPGTWEEFLPLEEMRAAMERGAARRRPRRRRLDPARPPLRQAAGRDAAPGRARRGRRRPPARAGPAPESAARSRSSEDGAGSPAPCAQARRRRSRAPGDATGQRPAGHRAARDPRAAHGAVAADAAAALPRLPLPADRRRRRAAQPALRRAPAATSATTPSSSPAPAAKDPAGRRSTRRSPTPGSPAPRSTACPARSRRPAAGTPALVSGLLDAPRRAAALVARRRAVASAARPGRDCDAIFASLVPYETARGRDRALARARDPVDRRPPGPVGARRDVALPDGACTSASTAAGCAASSATAAAIVMNTPEAARAPRRRASRSSRTRIVVSITNGFDAADFERPAARARRRRRFRIVHTGTMHTSTGLRLRRRTPPAPDARRGHAPASTSCRARTSSCSRRCERLGETDPDARRRVEVHLAGVLTEDDREVARALAARAPARLPLARADARAASAPPTCSSCPCTTSRRAAAPAWSRARPMSTLASGRPILAAVPDGDVRDILGAVGTASFCRPADVATMAAILLRAAIETRSAGVAPPVADGPPRSRPTSAAS